MNSKKHPKPEQKHAGHKWISVSGTWGPHRVKVICADCSGAWVKWGKKNARS